MKYLVIKTICKQKILLFSLAVAISLQVKAQPELKPTTTFFSVDNYYYPGTNGDYKLYRASGFYEPSIPGTPSRIFLLPQLSINTEEIKYFKGGSQITYNIGTQFSAITSINIPIKYSSALPTDPQAIGIAVQTGGTAQQYYQKPSAKTINNEPTIFQFSNFDMVDIIKKSYKGYDSILNIQKQNLERYKKYNVQATDLNELVISVVIDGDVVGERTVKGFSAGQLPNLVVKMPSEEISERIYNGNFEVLLNYRFKDVKVGVIDASFNVERIINSYISESQIAITRSRSSGMQVFNIGSRRTKVKQKMEQSLETDYQDAKNASTVIVMNDANEDQVKRFEDTFFPNSTKDETIIAHLLAAEEATNAGKPNLAKIHTEYANALKDGVALAEVDAVGAAAALNEGDYATFVAKGVRFMDASTNISGSFMRVAREKINTSDSKKWTDVSQISVQRQVSIFVMPEKKLEYKSGLGLINATFNIYPNVTPSMMLTCLTEDGVLHKAGIRNGEFIQKIGNTTIGTFTEFEEAMDKYSPGEIAKITFVDLNKNTLVKYIKLGNGNVKN